MPIWRRRILVFCVSVEVAIVLMDLVLNYYELLPDPALRRSFNVTREDSLGNWFSSAQALVAGVMLASIFAIVRRREAAGLEERSRLTWGWAVLAAFFLYMAVDDATMLHERLGGTIAIWFGGAGVLATLPSYAWLLTLGPLFAAMGVFVLWFLWRELPARRSRKVVVGALVCLAAAVLLDLFEGMDSTFPVAARYPVEHHLKLVEEFLEMLGITLFLLVFFDRLSADAQNLRLDLTE